MSDETRPEGEAAEVTTASAPESEEARRAAADAASAKPPGGVVLRGATVAPGLALGLVHHKDYDLASVGVGRVAPDEVDQELNRFRRALDHSQRQIVDLKARLKGKVPEDDARILDTHFAYLRDSVFIADVENLILNEQMRLDAAIAKVVGDFDRIFRLVQNDTLRQSAVDLRDVGIRVLRNIEERREDERPASEASADDYILVARELSIVDMFTLANEHVKGIVTKEGGMTSHAAVFARSMRIPTLIGVEDVFEHVSEGDFVILDATEGILRVDPDQVVREQYETSDEESAAGEAVSKETPDWALRRPCTRDGEAIEVAASCGNLPEVEQALELGMSGVGLYRTELLFLIDQAPPSLDALVQHYTTVVGAARGRPVTFRLLSVDSSVGIPYLHPEPERNPALGRLGIRALLAKPSILRRQLQAILLAGREADVRIALPFVTDCGELRRVKEILFEERFELRKKGETFEEAVPVGVIVEAPTAMLGVRDLALEADFLMLNLDALQQYLTATDRDNHEFSAAFEGVHPFVVRALMKAAGVAEKEARPLWVFGTMAPRPENVPLLIGAGLRHFCVPPSDLRAFLEAIDGVDAEIATGTVRAVARSACPEETRSVVAGYHHGHGG